MYIKWFSKINKSLSGAEAIALSKIKESRNIEKSYVHDIHGRWAEPKRNTEITELRQTNSEHSTIP